LFLTPIILPLVSGLLYYDGWNHEYSDVYDLVTFNSSVASSSAYYISGGGANEVYCIATNRIRSGRACLGGVDPCHVTKSLPQFSYDVWTESNGNELTVQHISGSNTVARYFVWVNKSAKCPDFWATSLGDYDAAGCPVDWTDSQNEGVVKKETLYGIEYELTFLFASSNAYLKCQGLTSFRLNSCIASSLAGDGGGDNRNLYEFCYGDTSSSSGGTERCNVASGHSLSFFDTDEMTPLHKEIFASGFPPSSFILYRYEACGTSSFDRDMIDTLTLSMLNANQLVCSDLSSYNVKGFAYNNYKPWYEQTSGGTAEFVYNNGFCGGGYLCSSSSLNNFVYGYVGLNACLLDTGSCYDGVRNRNETEVDYGGLCGNCSSLGRDLDYAHAVAFGSRPRGFFDDTPFSSDFCGEGEDATSLLVVFVVLFSFIIIFLVLLLVIAFFFLSGGFIAPLVLRLFRRKKETFKKEYSRNRGRLWR
jgi:hypothetical protein